MPELTDAQKVMRNDTGKSIAEAIANMSITVAGQEIEVSDTEPQSKFVDVWFQEQQQGTPVEVYTVPEINDMIAPAETSPTQAAHHVGEYIICVINGQAKLYKVIAEISSGETLTVGGNITATDVTSNLVSYAIDNNSLSVYNNAGITIAQQYHYRIGALHIYRVVINVGSSAIPAYTEILDGFANHYGGWVNGQPVFYGWNNATRQIKLFVSTNDTRVSCTEELPANTQWRFSFTMF